MSEYIDRSLFMLDLSFDDAARVAAILRTVASDDRADVALLRRVADQIDEALAEDTDGDA